MKNVTDRVRKVMQKTWEQIPQGVKVSWIFFVAAALCLHYFVEKPSQKQARVLPANSSGVLAEAKKELPIYCVKTNENKVALSFDAAWGAEDTIQILDILDKYNVKVTFFMTGGWVESFPDMVQEIHKRGHDLGNHSEHHKQMSKLTPEQNKEEIMNVHNKVKELTGYEMFLFRPPYGDYDTELIQTVNSLNYYPIQWSIDSLDWKDYGADNIVQRVVDSKKLENGAIILCHNGAKYTAQALERVICGLQDKGYQLVPISELIIRENYTMDNEGRQIAN